MKLPETDVLQFPDGRRFLKLDSTRLQRQLDAYACGDFYGIAIGRIHGFTGQDLACIASVRQLRGLHIQDPIDDASAVLDFPWLEYLSISEVKQPLDVSKIRRLTHLALVDGLSRVEGINACGALKSLYVRNLNAKQGLEAIAPACTLDTLTLSEGNLKTLDGIAQFRGVKELTIQYFKKLETVSALRDLNGPLKRLDLYACRKVADIESVAELTSLVQLHIVKGANIESLGFMRPLQQLEAFNFFETTVVDGKLEAILDLPKLSHVGMSDKRHYSHTNDALSALLSKRSP